MISNTRTFQISILALALLACGDTPTQQTDSPQSFVDPRGGSHTVLVEDQGRHITYWYEGMELIEILEVDGKREPMNLTPLFYGGVGSCAALVEKGIVATSALGGAYLARRHAGNYATIYALIAAEMYTALVVYQIASCYDSGEGGGDTTGNKEALLKWCQDAYRASFTPCLCGAAGGCDVPWTYTGR